MKMRVTGAPPKMAIYTDGDDAPFVAPQANVARVRLHTDLDYLGILNLVTGSVTPSTAGSTTIDVGVGDFIRPFRRTNLFAHGLSYAPLLVGSLTGSLGVMPIGASPPFDVLADANHVFMLYPGDTDAVGSYPYQIGVTNYGLLASGTFRVPPKFDGVRMAPSRVQCGGFDTDARYLQRDPAGSIPIVIGPSVSVGLGRSPSSSPYFDKHTIGVERRYSVSGVVIHSQSHRVAIAAYPAINDTFAAQVVMVTA